MKEGQSVARLTLYDIRCHPWCPDEWVVWCVESQGTPVFVEDGDDSSGVGSSHGVCILHEFINDLFSYFTILSSDLGPGWLGASRLGVEIRGGRVFVLVLRRI